MNFIKIFLQILQKKNKSKKKIRKSNKEINDKKIEEVYKSRFKSRKFLFAKNDEGKIKNRQFKKRPQSSNNIMIQGKEI